MNGRDPNDDSFNSFMDQFFKDDFSVRDDFFMGRRFPFNDEHIFRVPLPVDNFHERPARDDFFTDQFQRDPLQQRNDRSAIANAVADSNQDLYIKPPENPTLFDRLARGSRNILNKLFSRFDDGSPRVKYEQSAAVERTRRPTLDDFWQSPFQFFDREPEHLRSNDRSGFFDKPPFFEHPEGAEENLPKTMFRSYSTTTTTNSNGERITKTTIRDEKGTRTTIQRGEDEPRPIDFFDGPEDNDLMPRDGFGGLFGTLLDRFRDMPDAVQQQQRRNLDSSPTPGNRDSLFTNDFLESEQK